MKKLQYQNYKIINFIITNYDEHKLILKWRNDNNVRKWMINKELIPLEEHLKYIKSLQNRDDKICFLVKNNCKYLGIIEFSDIDNNRKIASIGLNINTESSQKGIGSVLMEILIFVAKDRLNLKKINLYVFNDNLKAVKLYKKFNFQITNKIDTITYMEKIL